MTQPYLGEIKMFGGNFAPRGYALCNGQLLSIAQNTALFSILGTTYGGNGVQTFALPNLQSRVPIHWGQSPGLSAYVIGQFAGTENNTLLTGNLPSHQHTLSEANAKAVIGARTEAPNSAVPNGGFLGASNIYVSGQTAPNAGLKGASVAFGSGGGTDFTGSSIPVNNIQPYLCVTFIIALEGIFPSRN
jgi:microcystin-dependent protein